MNKSELFALHEWLSDSPTDKSYNVIEVIEDLVTALKDAIQLAQEDAPDMIDDDDFNVRLNRLQVIIREWEDA